MMVEAGAQALESISPPVEPVTYVEVQPHQQPRRSLSSGPPVQRVVPGPAQSGARPNQNLPSFPFPPPLELPPVENEQPALPNGPPPGPRRRGRPRKNPLPQENGKPQLFTNGRAPQAPPLVDRRDEWEEDRSDDRE
jgi:hypothetical protein